MHTRRAVFVLTAALIGGVPLAESAAEFWADRPIKIIQTSQAQFPPALASQGVTEGKVRAVLSVDAAGKLTDFLITGYTHRELAREVAASLRQWEFEPAWQRGQPIGVRSEVVFDFEGRGMVLSLSPSDALVSNLNRIVGTPMISLLCRPSELDAPLRAVHAVSPQHPGRAAPPSTDPPVAVIDFYVDADGRPHMPVVQRASHELYAMTAIEALLQWRFTAPTRGGQPILVRATQVFNFGRQL